MSERWWRRKKRHHRDPWFGDVFKEFDRLERMMDEMMRQAFESPSSKRRDKRVIRRGPYVYGFSISTGPDGKPVIKEFGNIRPNRRGLSRAEIREIKEEELEPLIDVLEQDKEVIILAQLPGVNKEDIDINVTETQITITVDTEEHSYYKKLQLPAIVDPKTAKTTYKNGVLQIKLQKMPLAKTPY
ncbi:MAG: archaeal heat shock protein Hsp20 [Candidatus Bathyarchaeia archaeon]